MQNKFWFFGSKLNTALLLILIILMCFAIHIMLQNKETYLPELAQKPAEQTNPIEQVKPIEQNVNEVTNSFTIGSLSFSYPPILSISKSSDSISLAHSISYQHKNYCDSKGDAPLSNSVNDFTATFKLASSDLKSVVGLNEGSYLMSNFFKGDTLTLSPGFIDEYKAGILDGYVISSGVEGCGRSTYYFPISSSETLVVYGPYVNDLQYSDESYLKLPGFITHEQEEKIFRDILLSVKK